MADLDDVRGMARQVQKQRESLEDAYNGGDVTEADYNAIRDCWRRRKRGDWDASGTRRDRLSQLRMSAKRTLRDFDPDATDEARPLEKPLTDYESAADVDALLDIHAYYGAKAQNTQRGYASALKSFFRFLDNDAKRGDYGWYENISVPSPEGGTYDPEDMMDERDIARIREAASDPQTEALVEFLADTGARISAALQVRREDIRFRDGDVEYRLNPEGANQKGADSHVVKWRKLYDSAVYVRRWVNSYHPEAPNVPDDAPLWTIKSGYDPENRRECAPHPRTAQDWVDAAVAKVDGLGGDDGKPTNHHSFRHACVKRLKWKYGFDWDEIADRVAWSENSIAEMATLYGPLDADERKARMDQKANAVEDGDGDDTPEPITCGMCGTDNTPAASFCQSCGHSFEEGPNDGGAFAEVREMLSEMDDTSDLGAFAAMSLLGKKLEEENPGIIKRMQDMSDEDAERMISVLGGDADLERIDGDD
jgi:integrase